MFIKIKGAHLVSLGDLVVVYKEEGNPIIGELIK